MDQIFQIILMIVGISGLVSGFMGSYKLYKTYQETTTVPFLFKLIGVHIYFKQYLTAEGVYYRNQAFRLFLFSICCIVVFFAIFGIIRPNEIQKMFTIPVVAPNK